MLETTLKYFNELSKIPRCSKNENAIINWLISWAEKNNFLYKTDNI
jgi:di/tripeptidase